MKNLTTEKVVELAVAKAVRDQLAFEKEFIETELYIDRLTKEIKDSSSNFQEQYELAQAEHKSFTDEVHTSIASRESEIARVKAEMANFTL